MIPVLLRAYSHTHTESIKESIAASAATPSYTSAAATPSLSKVGDASELVISHKVTSIENRASSSKVTSIGDKTPSSSKVSVDILFFHSILVYC